MLRILGVSGNTGSGPTWCSASSSVRPSWCYREEDYRMEDCNLKNMTRKLLSQNYLHQIFNNQIFTRKLSKNSNNFRKTTGCFEIVDLGITFLLLIDFYLYAHYSKYCEHITNKTKSIFEGPCRKLLKKAYRKHKNKKSETCHLPHL